MSWYQSLTLLEDSFKSGDLDATSFKLLKSNRLRWKSAWTEYQIPHRQFKPPKRSPELEAINERSTKAWITKLPASSNTKKSTSIDVKVYPVAGKNQFPTATASCWYARNYAIRKSTGRQRRDTLNCLLENKDEPTFRLNPRWVEWLMNWPIGWTDLAPLPPERFKDWEQKSLDQSWWDVDPADEGIPRIAEDFKLRKPQLIAIGNGQVPTQIVLAEHLITQLHLHR